MQKKVVDHIIIGDNAYFSFASEGLIEEYELDFISLKMKDTDGLKQGRNRAGSNSSSR